MATEITTIAFIGLGAMGEPMAMNLLSKSRMKMRVFDLNPEPKKRLAEAGATAADSLADAVRGCEVVFLSLPGGKEVEACLAGDGGILENAKAGTLVVDMSTSPVDLTRALAEAAAARSVSFIDAPVARTRQAARDGTLSIMVGGDAAVVATIEPLLNCMGADITHCGGVGAGQVAKILNNMVLFQTVVALSEAVAVGRGAGVDPQVLLQTLSKGSADSFALRNHGMKAIVPGDFPKAAFSTAYALKDVTYAIELADYVGYRVEGAQLAKSRLEKAVEAGFADEYFPVISTLVDKTS